MVTYIPDRGDLVWLQFNPQSAHEQAGRRPALVLTPKEYNQKVGVGIFCPVTSHEKGYPFEVKLRSGFIEGVILADQVKSLDWKVRNARFVTKVSNEILEEVIDLLDTLIF